MFDELWKSDKKSIVLVVSPLIALMKDQVDSITAMGLSAIHISDRQFISTTVKQSVKMVNTRQKYPCPLQIPLCFLLACLSVPCNQELYSSF